MQQKITHDMAVRKIIAEDIEPIVVREVTEVDERVVEVMPEVKPEPVAKTPPTQFKTFRVVVEVEETELIDKDEVKNQFGKVCTIIESSPVVKKVKIVKILATDPFDEEKEFVEINKKIE